MLDRDWARRRVKLHLRESALVKLLVADRCVDSIVAAALLIADCFRSGGKLLLCGNGGSAADCQHLAAEYVSRLTAEFKRPGLPAIALTTDSSIITAHANDFSFEDIFERQVQAIGQPGDVLFGISTSGRSKNVLRAIDIARNMGLGTVLLVGGEDVLVGEVDVAICVPSRNGQYVQESQLAIEHLVCDLSERLLFGDRGRKASDEAVASKKVQRRRNSLKRAG